MTGTKESVKSLNAHLDLLQHKVYDSYKMLLQEDGVITAERIKNRLTGVSDQSRMILQIFQNHNDQMKALVGAQFARLTYTRYTTALEHTREFIQWKYHTSYAERRDAYQL